MRNRAVIFLLAILLGFSGMSQTISNYNFVASGGSFTTISGTMPGGTGTIDEGVFNAIPIGFDFWYMGIRYTTVSASTNGWMTLGGDISDAGFSNNLSNGGAPRPVIAPLWDDLDIQAQANAGYLTTGSAGSRIFTLQFVNNRWNYQASGSTISYQVKLYEGTGRIQFVYRRESGNVNSGSASIGLAATGTGSGNFLSLNGTGTNPSAFSTTETRTLSTKPLTGQTYSFTPVVPGAPTQLTFTGVTSSSMTLNWLDNASNEAGYVIYRSTDNINFTFVDQAAANAISSTQSGLAGNTTYYWKVMAVTEGALSNELTGNQLTLCASSPAAPTVTTPVVYCQGSTSIPLSATGSNLLWGGGEGTVGGNNNLTTATYVDGSANIKKTNFTTTTAGVNVVSVDYFVPANQSVTGLVLSIYNSTGTILATSPVNTTLTAGASPVKITNTFNYTIPAAGDYAVGVSAGSGNIGADNPGFPIIETTGTINITGVSHPGSRCFNNIRFSTSASTSAPTPSTAVAGSFNYSVTQNVGGCISTPANITVTVNPIPSISQLPTSNLISSYTFSGNANDVSGSNNTGTLQNAPALTTDRSGITNKAYSFNGSNQYISTANAFANPANFTISIWFKTNSITGGKLIGFGSSKTGSSGQYDRHLYMNNAGQIYFGVYPNAVQTVNSNLSYNDGNWHLATATLSATAGMVLYMDGVQVGSNAGVKTAQNFSGYWKIGYDNTGGWTSQPTSFYFNGSLDDVLIYGEALNASQVSTLYKSPDGAGNSGPVCAGSALTLTAPAIGGATYSWTGPNGFNSTSQSPSFTYIAANAGVYNLQVTSGGCTATAYTTVISSSTQGQWTGNVSTDWADAANWCAGVVPTSATDVLITAGATRMPQVITTGECKSLTINSSATVTVNNAGTLSIAGTLANSGTYTDNGTTVFNGTTGQQVFTGVTTFNNLTLDNSAGLILPASITVKKNLTITTGILVVNAYNITVGADWINNSSVNALTAGVRTVTFNGTTAQSIGGTFATTFNDLIILNTASTVTLAANANIAGNLFVTSGTFDLASFTANRTTAGGTLTVSNNARLQIGGTNTYPANFNTSSLAPASTVEYAGTNQTVVNRLYGNLTLSSASGAAVKTMPASSMTIEGNLTSIVGSGTSVSYTAAADITIYGIVSIGAGTSFDGGAFITHAHNNWANSGSFNGNTGTVIFHGPGKTVGGAGAQNFHDLTVAASPLTFLNATISISGNLATTGPGAFTQDPGGTLIMTGTAKTITGSGISPDNLTISGSVTTASSIDLTGNLTVSGSFAASAGTFSLTGTAKTISGPGSISFSTLAVPGTITTAANFSVSKALDVIGNFTASAGTATFTGTSTLSGAPDLFNVEVNGTFLELSANSSLGIANVLTLTSGTLDAGTSVPNTVNFNGSAAQIVNALAYSNLVLSNGNTKTAAGNLSTSHSLTIGSGTTFNPSSYTISVNANWVNNGSFAAGTSTVEFVGDALSNLTGATTFNILTRNATTANSELFLHSNVVASVVHMTNGIISTGTKTLQITNTRTGNGFIYGHIQRTHAFTTGVSYAFEGPNNTVNFSAVSGVSSITVSVKRGSIVDFPFGAAIARQYTIAVPAGTYTATLRLHYENAELNGNIENNMGLWNYNGTTWVSVGKTANDATANYVEYTGLADITNRWTCSDNSNLVVWNGSLSSDWNTAANWTVLQGSATAPPSATDIVNLGTVAFGHQPTISNTVAVRSINFGSAKAVTLSMASGGSLTSGDIHGEWAGNSTHTINANNQTITVNGNLTLSDNTAGHEINLTIGTGTVTISGSLEQAGAASIVFSSAGNLNIGENFNYISGTFTPGIGTVTYNGINNQIVGAVDYNNLTINKAGGKASLISAVTVSGNLSLGGGEFHTEAPFAILGDVTIANGASFHNLDMLSVGGNWLNNGLYETTNASITFNGSGSQTISSSTFNNLIINKPFGTVASITGDILLKGNFTLTSGTFDIGIYNFNREVSGGIASIADAATFVIGANNVPDKFTSYAISAGSTIHFNGTATQNLFFPGISLGNLILSNSGEKVLSTPLSLLGNLTIQNGATFTAGANTITLNGNWVNDGNFTAATSTVVLKGAAKTVTGITTFNRLTVTGSYSFLNNMTLNGLLNITSTGSVSGGNTIVTTLNGDLTNSGTLYTLGTVIFTGNVLQTLSLLNAVQTVAVNVYFNGTVSPALNSTSAPQFMNLYVNNTGGINPSVGYTVLNLLHVGAGASINAGIYTHDIMGSLVNNGTITSSGILNFTPATAASINLGTNFISTGRVAFGGAGAITLSGTPQAFSRVVISNTHPTGISPNSNWNMASNFTVNAGSIFNAGSFTYTVGGNISHPGVVNAGTSTFILNGSGLQDVSTANSFHNLTINNSFGAVALYSNLTVAGVLNFVAGKINTGVRTIYQPATGTATGAAQNTGWVNGNLKKNIPVGTNTRNFEVGDSSKYTPVNLSFSDVSSPGDVLVFTTAGDHENLIASPVAGSKTANRYWTVMNEGTAFSTYDATFNYHASDLDANVNTANLSVVNHNGSSWYVPVTSAQNPTSTTATGLTNFHHFIVGEICNQNTSISYMGSPYCTNAGTATVTIAGTTGGIFSAGEGLNIHPTTGEIVLATSTPGTYVVVYTIAATGDCQSYITNTSVVVGTAGLWTGAIDTVWTREGNWSCGGAPGAASNLLIPAGLTIYPVITGTQALHNITVESGASLTIQGHLKINGTIVNTGAFDVSNGTLEFDGLTPQTIPDGLFAGNKIKNLIISNDVSLLGIDSLTGTLTVAGGKTFTTNDKLILKSTAAGTARVAALPVDGSGVATATITGNISIERHLPRRNSWRLLSAPVKAGGAPSINASWQEGVTTGSQNPNPVPGYGVFVQGGPEANGFDQGLTSNPTVKVFNNSSNSFVGLPGVPGTGIPITTYPGYFVFLRGNRSIDLMQGTGAAITASTLRMKGQLNTGNVTSNVNATGYTVLGNPYASAINFATLTRNNVRNGFYAWDPQLSGNFGLGGYVTASWDSIGQQYDFTSSVSQVSQYIASGQAILVQSGDSLTAGSIVVKESDKTIDGSDAMYGRTNGFKQQVRVNLLSANANGSTTLIDGILTTYDDEHRNVVNRQDAVKLTSGSENVGIKRDGKMLAIERRKTITASDTTFLNLYQMRLGNYKLAITTNNMHLTNTVAVVKDSYTNTTNNLPVDMNGVTIVPFTISNDPGSYATGRFSIVFNPVTVLPVTFTNVKAYAQQKEVAVEWSTSNEVNVQRYEVERSEDAVNFSKIATSAATGNNGAAAQYKVTDAQPLNGNNFYRIKSVDVGGQAAFSKTVSVNMSSPNEAPSVNVYPNPVVGKTISLQFGNMSKGQYRVVLYSALGQVVASKTINYLGNNATQYFEVNDQLGAGKYELQITGNGVSLTTSVMKR